MVLSAEFRHYTTITWHALAFLMSFASFAVPTIFESAESSLEFGWPLVQLGTWSVVLSTMFCFLSVLLDIYPENVKFRRRLDFFFSAVVCETTYCTFLATIASIVFLSLPNHDTFPSSVDDATLWSTEFITVFLVQHGLASIVSIVEAFTNYHYYHGRLWQGLLAVTVYGLLYALWHVVIYVLSNRWPYYFEAMLPLWIVALIACAVTLVRLLWYCMWRAILRRRWRRHIDRDLAFEPHRNRGNSDIPSIGGSLQWRSSGSHLTSTINDDELDDVSMPMTN